MQLRILKHIISQGILKILDSLGLPYFCGQGVPQHGSNVRKRFVYSFVIKRRTFSNKKKTESTKGENTEDD